MPKQVRISDEIADWLAGQGGSLSAAAERTLAWARDAIDSIEEDPQAVDEPVDTGIRNPEFRQNGQARAGDPVPAVEAPSIRDGVVHTSSNAARRRAFSPIIRRW